MRQLRHVCPDGASFEITTRTVQGRFLLPVGDHFRSLAIGIIARAKERYPVRVFAFGGLRNHLHMMIGADDVGDLAGFMCFVNGNLAREAGRIVDWKEKFWGRRYTAIEISAEENALVARLRYLLSHGPKENLVSRCRDWPGIQCVDALTEGAPLEGHWVDRSREYEYRRHGKAADPETFITRYTLELDPLPCWRDLPPEEIQRRIREMVDEIDAEAAIRAAKAGIAPLGVEAIRRQDPHGRPERSKRSPAPAVHAASKAVRQQLKEAYRLFVEAYRAAADRLRAGNLDTVFPAGCFPPAQPHIPSDAQQPSVATAHPSCRLDW